MTTHSIIFAWATLWTEKHGGLHSPSVQFSRSAVSDSLRHHGVQHARLPFPSPIPRVPQMSQSIPGKPVFPALPPEESPTMQETVVRFLGQEDPLEKG